ncbi:acyl-CoA carboxylase epsilon subunit [Actinotalea sp.]|uniref:acyl-CoA carboxylase epsilon subunit n=1 Tax=Actinotalea sp. TaxID=1872145 RepID=UPI002CD117D3|nr:acyl-CoA carboxylase epsilon subunit [Actinotalea sp.]HQY33409.1 acyl-CoA carboxylase epsilon subunit [Actinotalea sp.]HRA50492.1 acyl-CoA carboxylase epsilon subunit [Actinotalea sp.]
MTPDVRVVRGEPDDVELAALVAGLAAGQAAGAAVTAQAAAGHDGPEAVRAAARRRWMDAVQRLSDPMRPGHDAWRWSARP